MLNMAQEKYNQQEYVETLNICNQLYAADAKNRHNLLLMGCTHYQLHNYDNSIAYNRAILDIDPNFPEAYSNMGTTYRMMGDFDAAIKCYDKALLLRPKFWDALNNLASLYSHLGRTQEAIDLYTSSIMLSPNKAEVHHALGNLHYSLGQVEAAKNEYTQSLHITPSANVCQNLARIFQEENNVSMAIQAYYLALKVQPNANCCNNLGILLNELRRSEEAMQWYRYGLHLDPSHVHLYMNLGSALKDRGQIHEGIQCYEKAIELAPDFFIAIANLANAYKDLGKVDLAIQNYQKALQLKPDFPDAFCNYVHSLWFICDWRGRSEYIEKVKDIVDQQLSAGQVPTVLPFHTFTYQLRHDQVKAISVQNAERVKRSVEDAMKAVSFSHPVYYPGIRLKVGYISSDFGNHPLSHLMQSIFGMHDTTRYEIFCYATSHSDNSSYRLKIETEVEHFLDCTAMDMISLARKVNEDGIHVLVNLNGYTKGARNEVFALQPAPVQVSYMGFAGTMGADYIQYLITDETVCPPSLADELYTEKLVYMPHCYFVNDHKQSFRKFLDSSLPLAAALPTKESLFPFLPSDTIVFANFNQMYKVSSTHFRNFR
jgi:protein O-GlcNAc transferase